ncbi:hypothetical protein D3C80_1333030 [compost metagenome]
MKVARTASPGELVRMRAPLSLASIATASASELEPELVRTLTWLFLSSARIVIPPIRMLARSPSASICMPGRRTVALSPLASIRTPGALMWAESAAASAAASAWAAARSASAPARSASASALAASASARAASARARSSLARASARASGRSALRRFSKPFRASCTEPPFRATRCRVTSDPRGPL